MNSSPRAKTRRVVFQPAAYRGMQRGINQMVDAIRPTLGPRPRIVAIDRILDNKMPELLDNGGVIARRIIQLPNRDEDVGAMFVREVLWQIHEQVGDGTATAAVLFQSVYNEGIRYLAAGGNATRLRAYLEKGMRAIINHLMSMLTPVEGEERLAQVAQSICYDPPLAHMLGEVFDIIGQYGRLEIRSGRTRGLEREYVEGMYWERGLVSREMITDHERVRTELEEAAILISDLNIEEPQQLFPVLELAIRSNMRAMLIVAGKISDKVIGLLLANKKPEKFQAVAVTTPGYGDEQIWALEDLAMLTGGRPFIKAAGHTFQFLRVEDFGRARRVWADQHNFGIVGGKGNPRALRQHIASLRTSLEETADSGLHEKLLKRIGKLMGGSATLWVGGATELRIEERVELAKRTAATMRGAIREGVLPGGGVALLACRPVLEQMRDKSNDPDARAAYRILIQAMQAPIRAIISNAGYDASEVMAEIKLAGPGHGFDVTREQVVDMAAAGIYDATSVLKLAVFSAIASAGLALTVDVLIHRKQPLDQASSRPPSKRKRL
jgi:chaperonin GroEL